MTKLRKADKEGVAAIRDFALQMYRRYGMRLFVLSGHVDNNDQSVVSRQVILLYLQSFIYKQLSGTQS
jgi:hypothetical protein